MKEPFDGTGYLNDGTGYLVTPLDGNVGFPVLMICDEWQKIKQRLEDFDETNCNWGE